MIPINNQSFLFKNVSELANNKLGDRFLKIDKNTFESIIERNCVFNDEMGIVDFEKILSQTSDFLNLIDGKK